MASSEESNTAATAEQLGNMSLGDSAERKDNDTEPNVENGTTPTKLLCSACDKGSDALMKCRNCKCVWYCDKECQNKHWKEHKKECKRIKKELDNRGGKLDLGTEKDVGPLGKLPPREECPICMRVFPIPSALQMYSECCGKTVCGGCERQHQMKSKERATCAFCREPMSRSNEEFLARLHQRVERKDQEAMCKLAIKSGSGQNGLSVDHAKCIDLLHQSAGLGYPPAHYQLGNFHDEGEMGLERNEEEALKHWEKAAEGGHLLARHNVGCTKYENDNQDCIAAMYHWRLSASGGLKLSMDNLIECFGVGVLHHGDLAETLQAFYRSREEMKSGDRVEYAKHLKRIGKSKEDYEY